MEEKEITYKKAQEELENILNEIENEEIDVDILSDKVRRASFLIKICQEKLKKTRKEVQEIFEEEKI